MVILALCGCEVIKEEERLIPVPVSEGGARTHVLVEFTGFLCVNCPKAAETAEALQNLYGSALIVVSLHPASNPFTQGLYDYTCPEADSVYQFMNGDATTPFPIGNIDFTAVDGRYLRDQAEWSFQLSRAMQDTLCPYLSVTAAADSVTREVHIETFLGHSHAREARLAIWLVEDSVHGAQLMPDGTASYDYIHRHMLRTTLNNHPFGTPITLNQSIVRQASTLHVPHTCNITNCRIIALLLDNNDYHILQAHETTLDFNHDYQP